MAITPLPDSPSLENLKKRAKSLLKSVKAGEHDALGQVGPYFGDPRAITLQQAQLVIARSHGFSSWTKLKAQVNKPTPGVETGEQTANRFLDLVTVVYAPVPDSGPQRFTQAGELLDAHPAIRTENIYTAAAIGDVEQIDRWLKIDPKLINSKGGYFMWEPIMYAAYARLPGASSLDAGLRLLERGADPNAYYMSNGQYKFTVLTGVFGEGEGGPVRQPEHPDMIPFARALLEAGANANDSQSAYNRCFMPDNACFELLLEYGLSAKNTNNWLLCEDDKMIPHPSETMHFHLIQSIRRGYPARAQLLIDHGVDLNKPDDSYDSRVKGRTPYEAAMLMGETEIAEALLAAGAQKTGLSEIDQFEIAVYAGDAGQARHLLAAHSDLPALARSRHRALLGDAISGGNVKAVAAMIDLGFDVNDASGRTPLHDAAVKGKTEIIQMLLDAGADPTARHPDHYGPPMSFAQYMENDEAIALLDTVEMDVFTAASRGNIEQLEKRLAEDSSRLNMRFADIRHSDSKPCDIDWFTPLAHAIAHGRPQAVRHLLDQGADRTVIDGAGRTLVTLAEEGGDPAILAMLPG